MLFFYILERHIFQNRKFPFFEDFLGNVLVAWSKAARGNQKEDSLKFLEKVPDSYRHLIKIQNTFLECYFDTNETLSFFEKLAIWGIFVIFVIFEQQMLS